MEKRKLITEKEILDLIFKGRKILEIEGDELFTPAAKDKISESGIKLIDIRKNSSTITFKKKEPFSNHKKVALGCDHTGFTAKNIVSKYLSDLNYSITDVGTFDEKSCDYPDFAIKVSELVVQGKVDFAVLFDATGIPSAITANKIAEIRAATCYNEFSARSAREHNNANIIVLGAKTLGEESIKSILNVWLSSSFLGDRHQKRLDKITKLEK